jgi:hypothetical protein
MCPALAIINSAERPVAVVWTTRISPEINANRPFGGSPAA